MEFEILFLHDDEEQTIPQGINLEEKEDREEQQPYSLARG
jgi:hypothetical protein